LNRSIVTERTELVVGWPEVLEAIYLGDMAAASALLGAQVPVDWPGDPEAHDGLQWHARALRAQPTDICWRVRFVVLRSERVVAGSINLKGAPAADGTCEIGWGITPERRRQGLAMEAANAVLNWAFSTGLVVKVIATIPKTNYASVALARRLRMRPSGERRNDRDVWAVSADQWRGAA
jgi:[ribosomal protein S5]-alanine N-acetyltransferase